LWIRAEEFLSTGVSFATVIEAERAADPARWHKRGAQLPGMLRFTLATKGQASRLGVRGRRFVATEYLLTTKISPSQEEFWLGKNNVISEPWHQNLS